MLIDIEDRGEFSAANTTIVMCECYKLVERLLSAFDFTIDSLSLVTREKTLESATNIKYCL